MKMPIHRSQYFGEIVMKWKFLRRNILGLFGKSSKKREKECINDPASFPMQYSKNLLNFIDNVATINTGLEKCPRNITRIFGEYARLFIDKLTNCIVTYNYSR